MALATCRSPPERPSADWVRAGGRLARASICRLPSATSWLSCSAMSSTAARRPFRSAAMPERVCSASGERSRPRRALLSAGRGQGAEWASPPGPEDLGCQGLRLAQVPGQDVSRVPVPRVQGFGLATLTGGLHLLTMARASKAGWADVKGCGPAKQPAAILEVASDGVIAGGPGRFVAVGSAQSEQWTVKRNFEGAPPLRVICGSN